MPAPVLTVVRTPGLALECPISFDSMLDVPLFTPPTSYRQLPGSDSAAPWPPTRETSTRPSDHLSAAPACHVRPKAFYVACRVRRSLLRGIFPPVNRQSLAGTIQLNHG